MHRNSKNIHPSPGKQPHRITSHLATWADRDGCVPIFVLSFTLSGDHHLENQGGGGEGS